MTSLMINGMPLEVAEYRGQRVVTFKMIDAVHQRPVGTAKAAFTRNRKHFVEGKHFFALSSDEIGRYKLAGPGTLNVPGRVGKNASQAFLFTETGYLMIVKPMTDDLSWRVQGELVDGYFSLRAEFEAQKQRSNYLLAQQDARIRQQHGAYFERYPRDKEILYHITHGEPYWFAAERVRCHVSTVSAAVKRMLKWAVLDTALLASSRTSSRAVSALRRKYRPQLRLPF